MFDDAVKGIYEGYQDKTRVCRGIPAIMAGIQKNWG